MAQDSFGARAYRDRRAQRNLRAVEEPRAHRGRRGARDDVQTGGSATVSRARPRCRPGEDREVPGGSSYGCSVALTFHRHPAAADRLNCHLCGHPAAVPKKCPACGKDALIYAGFGTEKVESTVSQIFPKAVVRRMDADSMTRKEAYRETLRNFRTGKIDILVGTQMIAKGLHFPNVTLVGIINADLALHLPDFRAGERPFH